MAVILFDLVCLSGHQSTNSESNCTNKQNKTTKCLTQHDFWLDTHSHCLQVAEQWQSWTDPWPHLLTILQFVTRDTEPNTWEKNTTAVDKVLSHNGIPRLHHDERHSQFLISCITESYWSYFVCLTSVFTCRAFPGHTKIQMRAKKLISLLLL